MRVRSFGFVAGFALLFFAAPQTFAEVRFSPQVLLQVGHLDDVGFGGDSVIATETGDTITRVAVELPVERTTRTGSLSFLYRPEYEKYSDFGDLDNFRHELTLSGTHRSSRRMSTGFNVSFAQTQQQARPGSDGTSDLFVSTRTDQDLLRAGFQFDHDFSRRWSGHLELEAADFTFEPVVADGLIDPVMVTVEDRREYEIGYGVDYTLTSDATIGLEVRAEQFDFESGNEDEVLSLAGVWERTLGKKGRLLIALGLFDADSTPVMGPGTSDDGVIAEVRLDRETKATLVSLDLSRRPQPASSFSEVATTDALTFSVQAREPTRWNWDTSAGWARREGGAATSEVDRVSITAAVERRFGKMNALRLDAQWYDQTDDDPLTVEGSFSQLFMSWVWYPRGWVRGGS